MKRALTALVVAGLGVAAWWGLRPEEVGAPQEVVAEVAQVVVAEPVPDEPLVVVPVPIAKPLAALTVDAGQELEVTLEVFEGHGHLAAESIELRSPPYDPKVRWDFGARRVHVVTNLMGFARLELPAGIWEVDNFPALHQRLEVTPENTHFVIERVPPEPMRTIRGFVVDVDDTPIAGAEITAGDWGIPVERHGNRWGVGEHLRAISDARGAFTLTTPANYLMVVAEKGTLTSAPIIAEGDGEPVTLMLFYPSWLRFETPECSELFIQLELNGKPHELYAPRGKKTPVPSGSLTLRARCVNGLLYEGLAYKEIGPGRSAVVQLEMKRRDGIKVRLTNPAGEAQPGATLHLLGPVLHQLRTEDGGITTGQMLATEVTNPAGRAELIPSRLCRYAPVYDLALDPPLRLDATPLVQLGDGELTTRAWPH
jgi:hypothetical protein